MSEWISVKKGLPKETMRVLVFANDIVSSWIDVVNAYICPEYENLIWEDLAGEDYIPIVTHWMPLPNPPTPNDSQQQTEGE